MAAGDSAESQTLRVLEELVAWTRFQNREALRQTLKEVLSTDNDRLIYELTDGSRTGAEVARAADVSKSAVSQKWKAWRNAGIIGDLGENGPRHLASIESLGGLPASPVE